MTEFESEIKNFEFEKAFDMASQVMSTQEVVEQLLKIAYENEERVNMFPFCFAYKYKLLVNDLKWNYILMKLVVSGYIWYVGMPDIALESARTILKLDENNKEALQMIAYLYEECECHCDEEEYQGVCDKMRELGLEE